MERGIYAQGWYARQHNYHPSRPARRLRMLDDFEAYRGTMLTWPALGGGGISLPYLEQEADEQIPARFRFYGYVNDREFSAACSARGIKSFAVIFLMQGWEFPAELNDDEDEVLALNELRGVGQRTWLGLREFSQDRYPKLWGSWASYFPDGLRTADGRLVEDLWEEGCSRDIHGGALRADWLECPDREHVCHLMDTNNPVWREYVKAIIRIQVDAGVDGIQFDEPDGPMGSLKYGGCFCDSCMTGFTRYLQALDADAASELPEEVATLGSDFHYGAWLLAQGSEVLPAAEPDVLARAYVTYVRTQNAANFHELATYARDYAAAQGRSLLISANLYDGAAWHDPLVADVDILVPEQRHTLYSQPSWMRYIAAFGGDKPVTLSFNPYGGILPELVEELNEGRNVDRYRVMLYEAAALGVNMSVPYGAWMGSVIEDAMYAPHETTRVIQDFIADNEHLFATATSNDTAVAYSMDSNLHQVAFGGAAQAKLEADTGRRGQRTLRSAFYLAADALADAGQPFDVVILHDGVVRQDDMDAEALRRYRHLLLPDVKVLTAGQTAALRGYLDGGGQVTVIGDPALCLKSLLDHPNLRVAATAEAGLAEHTPQVTVDGPESYAVNLHRTDSGVSMHLINYDYDVEAGVTPTIDSVSVTVSLPGPVTAARIHAPGQQSYKAPVTSEGDTHSFTFEGMHAYAVAELI